MLASASELRAGLRRGIDPAKAKDAAKTTFGEFADAYLKSITTGERDWKRDLEVRCGSLRSKAFRDITTDDVLGVLAPIWTTVPRYRP